MKNDKPNKHKRIIKSISITHFFANFVVRIKNITKLQFMDNFNSFKEDLLKAIQTIEDRNREDIAKVEKMIDEHFHAWAESGENRLMLPDPVMVVVSLRLKEIFGKFERAKEIIKSDWYTGLFPEYYSDFLEFMKNEQAENEK